MSATDSLGLEGDCFADPPSIACLCIEENSILCPIIPVDPPFYYPPDNSGGAPSHLPGGTGPRTGGTWPDNETLGLPSGLNIRPLGLGDMLGLNPNGPCEFGDICTPIGSGFDAGTITIARWGVRIGTWIDAAAGLIPFLLLVEHGDGPPHIPGQECILTGEAKEGNTKQCWYSCPRPDGAEVIKWQWAKNGNCPQIANEGDLRASLKRIDKDLDQDASISPNHVPPGQYNEHCGGREISDK